MQAPIAWQLWHMARVEDVGVNRLATDGTQVLYDGNWQQRMNVSLREWGTSMREEEVTDLVERIDVPALLDYRQAVAERTVQVVGRLGTENLDGVADQDYVIIGAVDLNLTSAEIYVRIIVPARSLFLGPIRLYLDTGEMTTSWDTLLVLRRLPRDRFYATSIRLDDIAYRRRDRLRSP